MVSNLLQLQDAAKSFGSKLLFENATFSINEGEHIGVIGPNGAGKTTLFKILAGEIELDHGDVVRARHLTVGYLKQHDTWDEDATLESFLEKDCHLPLWDLKRLGVGLGLDEGFFERPIKSMSGGYRMRAKLLHLLGQTPNLMMLDEPTNYLDLETMLVLEGFLQELDGAFLLISHDREFLRRTTDHILEIESGEFSKYNGNIDDYFEQKALMRSQLERQAMSAQAKRDEVLAFAARFGAKASKARQVQSRIRQMNKMETIELKPVPITAKIRIPAPTPTGKIALELKDVDLGYGDKIIVQEVDLAIASKERVAIVGYNGAGKSTLLKALAKELPPLFGEVMWGYEVSVSYYAQHVAERLLPEETVLQAMERMAHRDVRPQEVLDLAGSLLFSGDNVRKKIKVLSGGEKARVALGQVLLKKSPVLLLDEPTNHLDFYTVESLTQALEAYTGTVIFVSHDRGFVRRVATKIIEIDDGEAQFYHGGYDDYVWLIQQRQLRGDVKPPRLKPRVLRRPTNVVAPIVAAVRAAPAAASNSIANKEQIKTLENERKILDKSLQDFDRKIKTLEGRLAEQGVKMQAAAPTEMTELARETGATQRKLEEFEAQYLEMLQKRDAIAETITALKA